MLDSLFYSTTEDTVTLLTLVAAIGAALLLGMIISLAGAFSLIRYRSAPGDPKDIAYVFFALAVGLACGMGFIPYAAVFTAILCLVMVVLHYTNFAKPTASHIQLTVTVPENLNYQGLFDDVLDQYTDS